MLIDQPNDQREVLSLVVGGKDDRVGHGHFLLSRSGRQPTGLVVSVKSA
jgi:hypothetical protein